MIYLVKSNTQLLIDEIIMKIVSSLNQEKSDVINFDFETDKTIEEAVFEYLSLSFENERKIIHLKNADFINAKSIDKKIELTFEKIINENSDNVIILSVNKINKTGKISKKYISKFNVLEKDAPKGNDLIEFIKNFFLNRNIKVDNSVLKNIYDRIGDNFDLMVTELKKIDILQKGSIDNALVNKALLNFSRERLYTIADCVFKRDIDGISRMIKQLIAEGESTFMISDALNRVGSGFLKYYQLREKGFSNLEIMNMTGWGQWMVRKYSDFFKYWNSLDELFNFYYETIVNDLLFSFIDYQPKNGLRQIERLLLSSITK